MARGTEVTEPRWLTIAASHIGTREIAGPKHNAKIIGWLQRFCGAIGQALTLPAQHPISTYGRGYAE